MAKTTKQRVIEKHPSAECVGIGFGGKIYVYTVFKKDMKGILGQGSTKKEAWTVAAHYLKE